MIDIFKLIIINPNKLLKLLLSIKFKFYYFLSFLLLLKKAISTP